MLFTDVTAAAGLLQARNVSGSAARQAVSARRDGLRRRVLRLRQRRLARHLPGERHQPRSGGARRASPRSYLFHNNRDGTFTDVTAKAGLTHSGWGQACCVGDYDNDGFDDLFVSLLGPQRALSQQRRRHVHRRLREGRRRGLGRRDGARAAAFSTTTATATSICSSPTM